MPSSGSRGRKTGGIPLGSIPKTSIAGSRIKGVGNESRSTYLTILATRFHPQLALRTGLFGVLRPVRFELRLANRRITHDFGVANGEVIPGTRFVKLLLDRKPGRLIEPNLYLRNL